jgi:hypothetical protein
MLTPDVMPVENVASITYLKVVINNYKFNLFSCLKQLVPPA